MTAHVLLPVADGDTPAAIAELVAGALRAQAITLRRAGELAAADVERNRAPGDDVRPAATKIMRVFADAGRLDRLADGITTDGAAAPRPGAGAAGAPATAAGGAPVDGRAQASLDALTAANRAADKRDDDLPPAVAAALGLGDPPAQP